MNLATVFFDNVDIGLLFGWFFKFINGLYRILRHTLNFNFAGQEFSVWELLCLFLVFTLIISAFIKSGGVSSDV